METEVPVGHTALAENALSYTTMTVPCTAATCTAESQVITTPVNAATPNKASLSATDVTKYTTVTIPCKAAGCVAPTTVMTLPVNEVGSVNRKSRWSKLFEIETY
jgi:hypothetical protein